MNVFIPILVFLRLCANSKEEVMDAESDFLTVSKTSGFVDKSMFIKTVFQSSNRLLITAPKKFGKSTNLDILKQFLSLASENNTKIQKTFEKLKIFENDTIFFKNNFANHPVLFVSFKSEQISSFEDALFGYKIAIHKAFLEHCYLIHSHKLPEYDQLFIRKWCDCEFYRQMKKEDVIAGLFDLVEMLKRHFEKKVVVLIDDYDSIINNALFGVESKATFESIISLTTAILLRILKENEDVLLSVLTGVSYISTTGLNDINNITRCRFLDKHPFDNFYGLTEEEVRGLFHKDEFKSLSSKSELVRNLYNGYASKQGKHVYNTFSLLTFLKTNQAIPHWDIREEASSITRMLEYPGMASPINELLYGKSINITVCEHVSLSMAARLKTFYSPGNTTLYLDPDLIFSHFLELGLLAYDPVDIGKDHKWKEYQKKLVQVRIPDLEVREALGEKFQDYFIKNFNLPSTIRAKNHTTFMEGAWRFLQSKKTTLAVKFLLKFCEFGEDLNEAFAKLIAKTIPFAVEDAEDIWPKLLHQDKSDPENT